MPILKQRSCFIFKGISVKNKIFHTQDLCSGTNLICAKNCAEMENYMKTEIITSDVLIIGGGTSGCYAALTIAEQNSELKVVIAEKANIIRSGCLAACVNALNAYITEGRKPEDYVDYATKDANGIVRKDLLLPPTAPKTNIREFPTKNAITVAITAIFLVFAKRV